MDGTVAPVALLDDANPFKLAVFGLNVSGGLSATGAAGRLKGGDWGEVSRLALAADDAGLDALIPIARWTGYGGATDWNDRCFETFTWAAGLAAITRRIQIFATAQVPTVHPVRAAKEAVTVDHISGGRFGLNVVAGWKIDELRLFGADPLAHDERYAVAGEFATVLRRLWAGEDFDFAGRYYRLTGAHSAPAPIQRPGPLLMSAGGSEAGTAFAARHADIQFLNLQTLDGAAEQVARIKRRAAGQGREVRVMTCAYIICRETEAAARAYFHHVTREVGDREAAGNMLAVLLGDSSFKPLPDMVDHVCAGFGGIPVIGTPAQVVDGLAELAAIGLDGAALSWIDYDEGIAQYRDLLLPLLRARGLRE